ncbi:MAG TPA: AI-2E family transporter [Candidatus Nanoarchaeia archaeon]|nr:AI-2E family transporter [Candidatus Nanoarchaeia archaeon]
MVIKEKDVKRYSAIALILVLIVVAFIVVKPILLSVIAGLILAYIFYPLFKIAFYVLREKNTAAFAVCILVVLILFLPIWFLLPLIVRQLFDVFNFFQTIDVAAFVRAILPATSAQLQVDLTTTLISLIGKISTYSLSSLTNFLLNLPTVLFHFAVIVFVFFFALRDAQPLKLFVVGLSPLRREKLSFFANQFKQITNSVIYGNFIIGIVQGVLTGVGLLIFGVPRALLLTILAIFAAILPVVGAWLVWIPAAIYMIVSGSTGAGIGFAVYSLLIVSTVDNILRPYLVSRNTKSSSVIVFIGMIGGLSVFGIVGLIIGPLVLEYLVLFLEAYKSKTFTDIFESE